MNIDGYVVLHFCAVLVSAVVLTVSLLQFVLLRQRWRLYFSLFIAAGIVFTVCDSLGILLINGPPRVRTVLFILFCITGILMIPILIKLYRFGMRFVLKRWEKRYLVLFPIPAICLSAAVFLYFSPNALPFNLIIVLYCSATGIIAYLLSSKGIRKGETERRPADGEREPVFFLLTIIVLLPLELLEYVYKIVKGYSPLFPLRLLVTPLFLLETGIFFTVTGFRTVMRLPSFGIRHDIPFSLTEREKEVSRLIIEGLTHREIAVKLFISRRTVDRHVENIYRKCGARNKADFIRSVILPN